MTRRIALVTACLATAGCGRSWVFDDLVTVQETSGGSGSASTGPAGATGGSTGRAPGTSGTGSGGGTSGGCVPEGGACAAQAPPCCAGLTCERSDFSDVCVPRGSVSSGSAGASGSTSGSSSGGTSGGSSSGGTTGGCSTRDCESTTDCCDSEPSECGPVQLSGCVFGVCVYENCGTAGGSTGGSTGGTIGGSSGGSTSSGGQGCNPNKNPAPLSDSCSSNSDCGCPTICVRDAVLGQVCESPCADTSECPELVTICNGTTCELDACGPGTGNGAYNSFCTVVSGDDGTCTPNELPDGTAYGVCVQGGSAETACNQNANRDDLSQACAAGMVCIGGSFGPGGVCGDVCNPQEGGPCPSGQLCAFTVDDPLAGACYTP